MSGGRQRPTWGKFKLQVQTTVDGYMAGSSGEMDWTTLPSTDDIDAYVDAPRKRSTASCWAASSPRDSSWAGRPGPDGEDQASFDWTNYTPKSSKHSREGKCVNRPRVA
jgi:hypothetical protein